MKYYYYYSWNFEGEIYHTGIITESNPKQFLDSLLNSWVAIRKFDDLDSLNGYLLSKSLPILNSNNKYY